MMSCSIPAGSSPALRSSHQSRKTNALIALAVFLVFLDLPADAFAPTPGVHTYQKKSMGSRQSCVGRRQEKFETYVTSFLSTRRGTTLLLSKGIAEEVSVCKAMKAKDIKAELRERGVACEDIFDKEELAMKLAEARSNGVATTPNVNSVDNAAPNDKASQSPEKETDGKEDLRREIRKLTMSEIKEQLGSYRADTRGLLEKSEFVELLLELKMTKQQPPQDKQEDQHQGGRNPDFRDVETKKMPRKEDASQTKQRAQGGGFG
eukprot:CAMPEP_0181312082 /NCGR_PEP_ID=MMETSP1101-20121128/13499_1 /TAXON_ID=46948 /ORGANISM="Rhodomonas abbreviata, Strain Caron Lab Isolate" /LENGTH=262 /DNA_ID=CAMNT_0023418893 /DNA_START=103 /DNA_END=887 /DNA_ORIENTATION=+